MTLPLPRKLPVFYVLEDGTAPALKTGMYKTCGCGCGYTVEAWKALPLLGVTDLGDGAKLTMRNCSCGSTLAELEE